MFGFSNLMAQFKFYRLQFSHQNGNNISLLQDCVYQVCTSKLNKIFFLKRQRLWGSPLILGAWPLTRELHNKEEPKDTKPITVGELSLDTPWVVFCLGKSLKTPMVPGHYQAEGKGARPLAPITRNAASPHQSAQAQGLMGKRWLS